MAMSRTNVAKMLAYISSATGRAFSEADVNVWHDLLAPYVNSQDSYQAVSQLCAEKSEFITPAIVNKTVRRIRDRRIPDSYRIENEIYRQRVPAELDTPQFRQQLISRLGDGVQLDKAVTDSMTAVKQIESKPQRETVQYQKPQNARNVSSLANVVREVIG